MELKAQKSYENSNNILLLTNALSYERNLKTHEDSTDEKESPCEKRTLFLRVLADMNPERAILPKKIIWSDGREFDVEKITDIRRGFIKEIGELCMKYYCLIDGNFRILCLNDDMRWFVLKWMLQVRHNSTSYYEI